MACSGSIHWPAVVAAVGSGLNDDRATDGEVDGDEAAGSFEIALAGSRVHAVGLVGPGEVEQRELERIVGGIDIVRRQGLVAFGAGGLAGEVLLRR